MVEPATGEPGEAMHTASSDLLVLNWLSQSGMGTSARRAARPAVGNVEIGNAGQILETDPHCGNNTNRV